MKVVVYLNWSEYCFRANESDLKFLKSLLPPRTPVVAVTSDEEFVKALKTATHVITWHFKAEWYALAPKLQLVATPAAGQELIAPPSPSTSPSTSPSPSTSTSTSTLNLHFGHFHGPIMAENVAAFCLAWARGFWRVAYGANAWPRTEISREVFELKGTKAVILGCGNVGKAIAEKLCELGVDSYGFSRHQPLTAAILRKVKPNWFILALPSTTGTDDVVDAKFLCLLPRNCVLINVGRGNAVDEKALIEALKTDKLAGAYLDVIKNEPSRTVPLFKNAVFEVTKKSPVKKLGLENKLFISPHSSAFSLDYLKKAFQELKDDGCI